MLRALIRPAFQSAAVLARNQAKIQSSDILRKFSQLSIQPAVKSQFKLNYVVSEPSILQKALLPTLQQNRSITKFSLRKGKRKTAKCILKRFKRLEWGIWIRTIAGRQKRIWKKSPRRRYKCRQHVFVNAQQSTLLDKMVTKFWKKPKYWVDDIYRPYHSRESFWMSRKKPIEWD